MTFTDFMRERYPDSVVVTPRRYKEAQREYRAQHGDPDDPVRAELYCALRAARDELTQWGDRHTKALLGRIDAALEAERNA
jgi:hypothetical protein